MLYKIFKYLISISLNKFPLLLIEEIAIGAVYVFVSNNLFEALFADLLIRFEVTLTC